MKRSRRPTSIREKRREEKRREEKRREEKRREEKRREEVLDLIDFPTRLTLTSH